MEEERTHTIKELERQKELDQDYLKKWANLSDSSKKRFKWEHDQILNRVKDNYNEYMKIKFINVRL
jgi:hypothetical protein